MIVFQDKRNCLLHVGVRIKRASVGGEGEGGPS